MKSKGYKRLLIPIIALCTAVFLAVGSVFSWFIFMRNSVILIEGDIKLDVEGQYAIAVESETTTDGVTTISEDIVDGFNPLNRSTLNAMALVSESHEYVIYQFTIKNLSDTGVNLSMRLSNFIDYLFQGIEEFAESGKTDNIKLNCSHYTAKNMLQIKYLKYCYGAVKERAAGEPTGGEGINTPDWTELKPKEEGQHLQMWHFSYGNYILGDSGAFKSVEMSRQGGGNDVVTLRMAIAEGYEQIDEYHNWLTDQNEYAYKYCANKLTSYTGDTTQIITDYLAFAKQQEEAALAEVIDPGSQMGFELLIGYFEFKGENIPRGGVPSAP